MKHEVCSEHTKHALEVHPNIAVFRHPDHAPSGQVLESEIVSGIKNFSLKTFDLAKLPSDGLKAIYGANDDIILYCKCPLFHLFWNIDLGAANEILELIANKKRGSP